MATVKRRKLHPFLSALLDLPAAMLPALVLVFWVFYAGYQSMAWWIW